jgi:shikimate dehydrogenase
MLNPTSECLLLGDPVGHSLSPLIHNIAFKRLNLPFAYRALRVPSGHLEETLSTIDGSAILGANVTIPHKQAVIPFLDELTEVAEKVGAVNTIYVRNGVLMGHNTDVEGFLAPLKGLDMRGKDVVILGAGGAARAVMVAAESSLGAGKISLVSRKLEKARATCLDLNIGEAHDYSRLENLIKDAGLIVNATPVGMSPHTGASPIPESIPFRKGQTVYDLIYNPEKTLLLQRAEVGGAHTIGGLAMLIAQAAASFEIWTGREMPIKTVEQELKKHLQTP